MSFAKATKSIISLGLVTLAVAAPAAHADTYCVLPDASCPADHTFASTTAGLQAALSAAASHAGADRVQIGAGHFQQPWNDSFLYAASDPVAIAGAGPDRTVLEQAGPQALLNVEADSGSRSSVSGIGLYLRTSGAGIRAARNTDVDDVRIDGDLDVPALGVALQDGSTFSHAAVMLPAGTGVLADVGIGTVVDTSITAKTAVLTYAGGAAYVQRCSLRVTGGPGLAAQGGALSAFDTTMLVEPPTTIAIDVASTTSASASATLKHLTVVGGDTGLYVYGETGHPATASLRESILRATQFSLARTGAAGSTATIAADHNDYVAGVPSMENMAIAGSMTDSNRRTDDPGFVNAPGDLRLRYDSPLIDAANPAESYSVNESPTDHDGNPRAVDGDADGSVVRDVGAYEYQRRAPSASASASATTARVGEPVHVTAQATDPDGDALSYRWSFHDGATVTTATTAQAMHAFATAGHNRATLLVTDSTGETASVSVAVDVTAATAPPPGADPPATGDGPGPVPAPTQSPVVTPPFVGVTVLDRRVRASATGRITLRVACPAAAVGSCTGRIELRRSARGARIARRSFTIAAGRTGRVTLQLSRGARTALRRAGALTIALAATAHDRRLTEARLARRLTVSAAAPARARSARRPRGTARP